MLCQCEHVWHGGDSCPAVAQVTVKTIYGTYELCEPCAVLMPAELKAAAEPAR